MQALAINKVCGATFVVVMTWQLAKSSEGSFLLLKSSESGSVSLDWSLQWGEFKQLLLLDRSRNMYRSVLVYSIPNGGPAAMVWGVGNLMQAYFSLF